MGIEAILTELNEQQKIAACMPNNHALILAGAGSGKTKTIIARAAYLISSGTPAHRIHILTFTRRSASEIVERVKLHLGDAAQGLRASTFHTWCISLMRSAPKAFGYKGFSIIDRDDQLQLFKVVRGKRGKSEVPTAAQICDLYSYARNTGTTLDTTLIKKSPEFHHQKQLIGEIMLAYESRKRERHYLDYDDILDVVAQQITKSPETREWVCAQYDFLLVDEMQDTNPLQWKLLNPLRESVTLFCVGDDAQSIYGFRGADFRNVHSFTSRVENSVLLKLEENYRSTQEILDVSNWLLSQSDLEYGKKLVAVRGKGKKPQLHTFLNEWEEGRWIAEDILNRHELGLEWRNHMVLVRSGFAGRVVEGSLLAKEIPYRFIGGTKLLESAHVRDLLSALRVVGNPQDEIAWMRFLTLWQGIGEVKATQIINKILSVSDINSILGLLKKDLKVPAQATEVIKIVKRFECEVSRSVSNAFKAMEELLGEKYKNQEWDKRRRDFTLVERLAEKHTSILGFMEEYLLDPVHGTQVEKKEDDDVVTVITIHSAKGTECEVCYVINVSPGASPSPYAIGDADEIEEERRVLYVAMTRAKDELIITRRGFSAWAQSEDSNDDIVKETYFLNSAPKKLFKEKIHKRQPWRGGPDAPTVSGVEVGITIG